MPATTPAISLAEISPEQTWAVVVLLIGLLVGVGGFAFRQLWNQLREQRDKNAKLEDQQEAERHASVIRGIEDLKADTRGIRGELHQLRRDHDELRPRVERMERKFKPEGGAA